jgi:hypothetical protein
MKDGWFTHTLCLGIGFMLSVVLRECTYVPVIPQAVRPDTIFVDKPYKVEVIKTNNVPVKVYVYKDLDTNLRNQREKQPIIEKVDIKGNEVAITTIDTSGLIKTDIHKIEPDSEVKIDNTGQVEEKKKTRAGRILKKVWKGTKTGLAIIGGVAVVVITLKAVQP